MMKKICYILLLSLIAILTACQKYDPGTGPVSRSGDGEVQFAYSVPDYTVLRTRSGENTVSDISLLQFDANGLFLGRSTATDMLAGTFKAKISGSTRIIHFIANYDWSTFDERGSLGKDEQTLIPEFESDGWVLWDRREIDNFNTPPQVKLLRNQAKVTVEIDQNLLDLMAQGQREQFTIEGFALYNYATRGTVASLRPNATDPFEWSADHPTLPGNPGMCTDKPAGLDTEPKYMFESDNSYNNQTVVILHAGGAYKKYYKIQLIDSELNLYPVVRNTHFRIRIIDYMPGNIGSGSVEDALNSPPINDLYAEIIKESPEISDGSDRLTVNPIVNILTNPGTGVATQRLELDVKYEKSNVITNGDLRNPQVLSDPDGILDNLTIDRTAGKVYADVKVVDEGFKRAEIRISAGALSRIVTVISCEKFTFEPAGMPSGINKGDSKTLTFNIPDEIPAAYFPLECVITARNLEPTNASRNNLRIESNADGSIDYIYTATQAGPQTVYFQNSRNHSGELVTISHPIFKTAYVGPALTLVAINRHHTTYLQNCVGYGAGQEALVTFYMSEDAFARQSLVLFHAPNLTPSDMTGFSDDGNGYYYYTPAGPGTQTVSFKVTSADLDQDEAARTVKLYHDNMEEFTSLTYEYYLVNTQFLRRKFKRANHATNLGNGKALFVVSAYALRHDNHDPATHGKTGRIEAEEIGSGLAHGWRQWYMIPGTRLDHLMLFEIEESSDRRATRTLRRIMKETSDIITLRAE